MPSFRKTDTWNLHAWLTVIERLWDDPVFEAEHRRRALAEARRWDSKTLAKQY
jgi:hypothetical protein